MPPEQTPEQTAPSQNAGSPLDVKSSEGLCSAKGCTSVATFDLQWNNPKIHTPDRRKHWLACAEHRESLGSFLSSRGFLKDVAPLGGGDLRS